MAFSHQIRQHNIYHWAKLICVKLSGILLRHLIVRGNTFELFYYCVSIYALSIFISYIFLYSRVCKPLYTAFVSTARINHGVKKVVSRFIKLFQVQLRQPFPSLHLETLKIRQHLAVSDLWSKGNMERSWNVRLH